MRPVDEHSAGGDPRQFDLLADGELSEAERRELLSGLDNEPGGWRQCALAFLEAQCLKQDLGALVRPQPMVERAVAAGSRRGRTFGRYGSLLAMAASFLVAMLLTSAVERFWHAGTSPADSTPARFADFAALHPQGVELAGVKPEAAQPGGRSGTVTLSMPGQGRQAIQLPVVERDAIDEAWLQSFPAAMPPDVLQALQRTGHQVQQHRDLLPLQMDDGRRLIVPVDQVEVHYVGNPTY